MTARAGRAHEWGVHAATPARQAVLSPQQLKATTATDPAAHAAWLPHHAALLDAVDDLHDTARLSQTAWDALRVHYDDAQLLELLVLIGWYRTISYLANGLLLEEEAWGVPFPAEASPRPSGA